MKVYVSGPMTGLPEFNFPTFDAVTAALREDLHVVFSPADNDRARLAAVGVPDITQVVGFAEGNVEWYNSNTGIVTDSLLRDDFLFIAGECEVIVMLPGWEASTGARWERVIAEALHIKVKLAVRDDDSWLFTDDEVQDRLTRHLREFPLSPSSKDVAS